MMSERWNLVLAVLNLTGQVMFSIRIPRILVLRPREARQIILKVRKAIAQNVAEEMRMYLAALYVDVVKASKFPVLQMHQSN